nr:hypothetical protein [Sphingomonas sp.]
MLRIPDIEAGQHIDVGAYDTHAAIWMCFEELLADHALDRLSHRRRTRAVPIGDGMEIETHAGMEYPIEIFLLERAIDAFLGTGVWQHG